MPRGLLQPSVKRKSGVNLAPPLLIHIHIHIQLSLSLKVFACIWHLHLKQKSLENISQTAVKCYKYAQVALAAALVIVLTAQGRQPD